MKNIVLIAAAASVRQSYQQARDTDRNPKGEDAQWLRAEHESGGRNGIAQDHPAIINHIVGERQCASRSHRQPVPGEYGIQRARNAGEL